MDNKVYDKNEFNWDDFREGKIAVWCETREFREDFLKQCDNNNIRWRTNGELASDNIEATSCEGEDCTAYVCKYFGIAFSDYNWFQEQGIKVIKWSIDKKNKIYKGWEIVKMISEGELKEGTVLKDDNDDKFTVFNNCLLSGAHNEFNSDYEAESSFLIMGEFTIVDTKKRYPFVEAFIAFEDGEEIEDKYGMCYRKLNSFTVEYKAKHMKKWEELHSDINIFSIDVIKGSWYINN